MQPVFAFRKYNTRKTKEAIIKTYGAEDFKYDELYRQTFHDYGRFFFDLLRVSTAPDTYTHIDHILAASFQQQIN